MPGVSNGEPGWSQISSGGGNGAIGRRARREEALAVGDDELVRRAQAQEGRAQFLGARGADVHLGCADEHALHVRIIRRRIQPQQDLDKGGRRRMRR